MRKKYILFFLCVVSFLFTGCHTVKNTVVGTGAAVYMVDKGIVDDATGAHDSVKAVDEWFQEKYW